VSNVASPVLGATTYGVQSDICNPELYLTPRAMSVREDSN